MYEYYYNERELFPTQYAGIIKHWNQIFRAYKMGTNAMKAIEEGLLKPVEPGFERRFLMLHDSPEVFQAPGRAEEAENVRLTQQKAAAKAQDDAKITADCKIIVGVNPLWIWGAYEGHQVGVIDTELEAARQRIEFLSKVFLEFTFPDASEIAFQCSPEVKQWVEAKVFVRRGEKEWEHYRKSHAVRVAFEGFLQELQARGITECLFVDTEGKECIRKAKIFHGAPYAGGADFSWIPEPGRKPPRSMPAGGLWYQPYFNAHVRKSLARWKKMSAESGKEPEAYKSFVETTLGGIRDLTRKFTKKQVGVYVPPNK